MKFVAAAALLLGLSGCAVKVKVESDTCWSGVVKGSSVEGCGYKTYDLGSMWDDAPKCVTFQKDTERGYLRLDGDIKGSTTAAYGVVSGCSR